MLEILRDILDSMLSAMGSRMINTTDHHRLAAHRIGHRRRKEEADQHRADIENYRKPGFITRLFLQA